MQVITTQKNCTVARQIFLYNREVRQSLTSKIWESIEKFTEMLLLSLQLMRKKIDYLGRKRETMSIGDCLLDGIHSVYLKLRQSLNDSMEEVDCFVPSLVLLPRQHWMSFLLTLK